MPVSSKVESLLAEVVLDHTGIGVGGHADDHVPEADVVLPDGAPPPMPTRRQKRMDGKLWVMSDTAFAAGAAPYSPAVRHAATIAWPPIWPSAYWLLSRGTVSRPSRLQSKRARTAMSSFGKAQRILTVYRLLTFVSYSAKPEESEATASLRGRSPGNLGRCLVLEADLDETRPSESFRLEPIPCP